MHLFTPCHTLEGPGMIAGRTYLLDDQWADELAAGGHCQRMEPLTDQHPGINSVPDNTIGSILILRAGGFGDLLFLSPSLADLRRRFPRLTITVATHDHTREALRHPDLRDIQLTRYPVDVTQPHALDRWDIITSAEKIASPSMTYDAAAYFAHHLGLISDEALLSTGLTPRQPRTPVAFSLKPLYAPDPDDVAQAWLAFPRHDDRPRIGIQTESSVKNRTYPVDLTADLIKRLIDDGADVYTFGYPSPKTVSLPHFYPLQCLPEPPSFTQSCAILATMDAVIAPDSALCHIAGALDIPTIALYGPFHWSQRTAHMPSVRALQGSAACSPCQWHLSRGQHYPPDQPCAQLVGPIGQQRQRGCKALMQIQPARIQREVWKWFTERSVSQPIWDATPTDS